jgi:hypothetical protein
VTTNYYTHKYDLHGIGEGVIEVEYSHTIYNSKGSDKGRFVQYYDTFRKITDVEFELLDANGNSINKFKKKDAQDISYSKSYETDDVRLLVIEPKHDSYPYTVICKYTVQLNGYVSLGDWRPLSGYNISVDKATIQVTYDELNPIYTHALNGMESPSADCADGRCSFQVSYNNLEAIVYDRYQKPLKDQTPRLLMKSEKFQLDGLVGALNSWESFGDWYLELNKSSAHVSMATATDIARIQHALIDPALVVDSIYKYMQNRTRYVSIQLGVGGMKSLPVDFVDQKGYGDCKALTNYTQHLLKKLFIPSHQVLVQAGKNSAELIEEFPSSQFNHVFLAVPLENDTIWLECTSQQSPSDYLGTFTDGRKVLWLENGKSKIITTPKIKAEENLTKEIIRINLTKQGLANCEIWQKKQGIHYDDASAYQYLDQEVIKKRNYEKFEFSDFTITDFTYAIKPDSLVLIENYTIDIPKFGKAYGGRLIVDLEEFSQTKTISSDSSDHYIKLRRGNSINQKIVIAIPEGLKIKYVAASMQIENEFGKYFYNVSQTEEEIVISKYYQLNSGTYEGEQFRQFKSFVNKVAETERAKILFVKKT